MKKIRKKSFLSGGPKNVMIAALILLGSLVVLHKLTEYSRQIRAISYSTFLNKVEQGQVKKVHVSGQEVYGVLKDGTSFETVIANKQKDWDILRTNNVEFSVASSVTPFNIWYLFPLLILVCAGLWAIWYYVRQTRGSGGGGGNSIFTMGKSRAKLFMPSTIKEKFDDVAGIPEAKEELQDIIEFLKKPKKFERLGAKITRGELLIGEPGNGKTFLARAVAGEANCPFFSVSGSDFIEVFVGIGAARVRDLFAQARKNAPCIVFIDEIDAVGRHRGSGLGGGHDEREQTLNQLLTEMDGFQTSKNTVIVIAATNRPDVLDKALLRPGRFDRQVFVPYPDLTSREQILQLHAKGVKLDADVDLNKIARGTPGFSGADLANLINEGALLASKQNQDAVTVHDLEEARDKLTIGKKRKSIILTEQDRKITAYHEAGHALIRLLLPEDTDPLHKVTIIPRGQALGVTSWLPERDKNHFLKNEMIALLMSGLGGRIAEELAFDTMTSGAGNDFEKVTDLARNMVCYYGMSDELGTVVYGQRNGDFAYSAYTAKRIDEEVSKMVKKCYDKTKELLEANRDKLNKLADVLLEKETLYANEIYTLLGIEPRTDHSFSS